MADLAAEGANRNCPKCEAALPPGSAFCTQCGEALAATAEPPAEGSVDRRRRLRGDAAEQARARHEFARIKTIVLTVRSVFWAEALYALVLALFWHVMLAEIDVDERGTETTLVTVLVWGQTALMTTGALLVMRAPLVWTAIGACSDTLYIAWAVWALDYAIPPALLFKAFLAVAFWFAVAQAARVQKLMAADPSLQIVRKRIDPTRKVQGGVADAARERRREEGRRALFGRLKLAGLVVVLLAIAIVVVREITKPPTVDSAVAEFAARWGRSDVAAITAQFEQEVGDRSAVLLREEFDRRGWQTQLPALGTAVVEARGEHASASWPAAGGDVRVRFRLHPAGWFVVDVNLPPIQAPDLEPALAEFRAAWAAKGTDALMAMVRESSRDRFGRSIVRLLEKRQWHEQRPALGDVDPGKVAQGRSAVVFAIGNDVLELRFEYWHPKWRLDGMRLPKE